MAAQGKAEKPVLRKQRTSDSSSSMRLSFGGSIRLNDLLNDDDEYGFAEEATERSFAAQTGDSKKGDAMRVDDVPPSPSLASSVLFSTATGACIAVSTLHAEGGEDATSLTTGDDASTAGERESLGGQSVGSIDSQRSEKEKEPRKGIGALIDKAKSKLGGKKEKQRSPTPEFVSEGMQCSLEGSEEIAPPQEKQKLGRSLSTVSSLQTGQPFASFSGYSNLVHMAVHHLRTMPFPHTRLYVACGLAAMTYAWPGFFVGFLWGLYLSCAVFLFFFVSEPEKATLLSVAEEEERELSEEKEEIETATEAVGDLEEPSGRVEYKGWMNQLEARTPYDPATYHVNSCRCVLVRLEGTMLRISHPARAVLKHAFHADPTLTQPQPSMVGQTIYDLTNATISLRPRRLAQRRWWSRKYPIHIQLAEEEEKRLHELRVRKRSSCMKRSVSMHPSGSFDERQRAHSEALEDSYGTETSEEEEECFSAGRTATVTRARSSVELSSSLPKDGSGKQRRSGAGEGKSRVKGIFLFARAAREKERWFHLLREAAAASRVPPESAVSVAGLLVSPNEAPAVVAAARTKGTSVSTSSTPVEKRKRKKSKSITEEEEAEVTMLEGEDRTAERELLLYRANRANFAKSMADAVGLSVCSFVLASHPLLRQSASSAPPPRNSVEVDTQQVDLGAVKWKPGVVPECSAELVMSVNALATRIFFDFCRDEYWCRQVKEKIQTKLATIHLPYFIENLSLSSLDLGTATPHIDAVYAPKVDEWGLWVDFEMKYTGGIRLALETRVNLLKLQSGAAEVSTGRHVLPEKRRPTRYSDEELPESPEDSPDEDFGAKMSSVQGEANARERAGSKIVSLVESAARSSFFQKAAKLPQVAKVITDISSTRLILNVEVEAIDGTMTVNLPPPPSDRIWYAFRKRPKISIRAVPQVGDRSVDFTTVSDWIESRLRLLLEKNLVCPNMDDVVVPVMAGNELLHWGYNT